MPQIRLAPFAISLPPAIGLSGTCALLDVDGIQMCWGAHGLARFADPPKRAQPGDEFVELTGSDPCARTRAGAVECWHGGDPETTRMAGIEHAIAVSGGHEDGCALMRGGAVSCWQGFDQPAGAGVPIALIEPAVQVVGGDLFGCARLASGRVQCWGQSTGFSVTPIAARSPYGHESGVLRDLADASELVIPGFGQLCAVRRAHPTRCFGADAETLAKLAAALPSGASRVALAEETICYADAAKRVVCRGAAMFPDAPNEPHTMDDAGPAAVIEVEAGSACVLRTDGTIACFGAWAKGQRGDGATSASEQPVPVRALSGG